MSFAVVDAAVATLPVKRVDAVRVKDAITMFDKNDCLVTFILEKWNRRHNGGN